jgi:hypothetical protein
MSAAPEFVVFRRADEVIEEAPGVHCRIGGAVTWPIAARAPKAALPAIAFLNGRAEVHTAASRSFLGFFVF